MPLTLHAHIPNPEQTDRFDIVLSPTKNAAVYAKLATLQEGARQRITAAQGTIAIIIEPIKGYENVHIDLTTAFSDLPFGDIVRRGKDLLIGNKDPTKKAKEIMEPPLAPETVVDLKTNETSVPKPKPGVARTITAEERARMKGMGNVQAQPDASQAANEMSKFLFGGRR